MVLGQMSAVSGPYRDGDLVVRPQGETVTALAKALGTVAESARARGLAYSPAGRAPQPARPAAAETGHCGQPDGYLRARPDGTFTKVVYAAEQPHPVPASQAAELRQLLALRDTARALLAAEAACAENTPGIGQLRADLGACYDSYLAACGPLNRFSVRRTGRTDPATGEPGTARIRPPQGGFAGDPFAPLVYALEEFDPAGQRAAKAAIFRERVIAPAPRGWAPTPPPTRWPSAWTPAARSSWTRSPGCSAPPATTPASSWARWCSLTRQPDAWYRPPSTCPGTSATSCAKPCARPTRTRRSPSTSPNYGG